MSWTAHRSLLTDDDNRDKEKSCEEKGLDVGGDIYQIESCNGWAERQQAHAAENSGHEQQLASDCRPRATQRATT